MTGLVIVIVVIIFFAARNIIKKEQRISLEKKERERKIQTPKKETKKNELTDFQKQLINEQKLFDQFGTCEYDDIYKVYRRGDSEYITNGHYRINKVDYMSIWTFKNKHAKVSNGGKSISKFAFTNTNSRNGQESIELINKGYSYYNSEPNFGNYSEIKIYKESDLKRFYGIN